MEKTMETVEDEVCCLPFDPAPWQETYHTFKNKKFIKGQVRQIMYIPLNYGQVIKRLSDIIDKAGAKTEPKDFLMLSYNPSPWKSEVMVAVKFTVTDADNVTVSGNFMTKVFDGRFQDVPKWLKEMESYVKDQGHFPKKYYFYYTTCPKCAKKYGHNYVVIFAEI